MVFWVSAQSIYPSKQIDTLWQNGQRREFHILYILQNDIFCSLQEMQVQSMQNNFMRSWSCKEQKILQKSGLHEVPTEQEFEESCGIFCFGQSSSAAIWMFTTGSLSGDYFYSLLMKGVASYTTICRPGWLSFSTYPENCTHDALTSSMLWALILFSSPQQCIIYYKQNNYQTKHL